ncbi:MAG: GNAT family N-acetyltransferase [Alphaproteobacteria bacterium]|nr:GNAT family N-acetyltransferase [Alphaproteobacteria bacterium]
MKEAAASSASARADLTIRAAAPEDADAVWRIIEPVIRAGETYALPGDMSKEAAIAYWFAPARRVFIARAGDELLGTYFLCANQKGGGDHVANAGYVTAEAARGRGIARAMCMDSIERASKLGFLAMQFNFVIATNEGAIRLWQSLGFETVGRLPKAFRHPGAGLIDVLVMYRLL